MIEYDKNFYYNFSRTFLSPQIEDNVRNCLGRKFATNIRKLDQHKINRLRSQIEDIKLQILDAAEEGKRPPVIEDVNWLYELYYSLPEYKFIYRELEDWMIMNGIQASFYGNSYNRTLRVSINPSKVNLGTSKDLSDTDDLVSRVLRRRPIND